jgi:predicted dehydrogenase
MPSPAQLSRRTFVSGLAATALAGPVILTRPARGQNTAPSERINLGFVGVGTMGRGHVGRFSGMADVQIVAICDVVAARREHCQKIVEDRYAKDTGRGSYKGCALYNDFRELLARDDIDAVVISTPDHWHALPAIAAAKAAKDIYCEKPLTRTLAEGRALVNAVAKHKVVFQTGSQQRSEFGGKFRQAVELIRNGHIGDVKTIRIGVGGPAVPCDLPEMETPEGIDWDLWLGPAPKRGFNEILCPIGVHHHFPAWRNYREYAGGGLADMGAHHFDIAQWALDLDISGPVLIEPPESGANAGLKFTYANGVVMFHGGPSGCTFEGTRGKIYVDRGSLQSEPADIASRPIGEGDVRVYHSTDHARNWIECIRSRKDPICNAETGHRSASVCHLGNIGYWLRRPLKWDPAKERFDDDEANKLAAGTMREPWKLES